MGRKMKDSGIEWIGEIPEGWELIKAKYLFSQRNEKGNSTLVLLSPTQKYGVIPQSQLEGVVQVKESTDLRAFKTIHVGDFVISLRSFQGGFEFSNYEGVCSPAYQVFHATKDLSNDFFRYLFKSDGFISKINSLTVGIREGKNIQYWDFSNMLLAVPPKEVQIRSAQYLNAKCSEIDTMLSKTRSSIEEYKKLKQAVITQAVTKGVRGEREMKDSGVEWIGEIPAEWKIKRLKSFCTIVDCKNRTPDVFPDGKYTVVRTTCIKDCSFSYEGSYQTDTTNFKAWTLKGQPHKGDIFFTREAPVGEACLVPNADNLCMGQRVMFFRPEDNSDARYIMYSIYGPLVREYIASKNSGSTVGHLKLGQVACIPIFYCPPLEQKEIADYLDAKCAEIDGLIEKKEQLVKELESHKKSLIYEVVTGKREV